MAGKKLKTNAAALIAQAESEVRTLSLDEAKALVDDETVTFVDLRDVRELDRDGMIPGAFHAPRGMLEFWVDPECKYFKDVFGTGNTFVFYCAMAWRSALATKVVQDMGLEPVAHIAGGYSAWKKAGLPTGERPRKKDK